MSELVVDSWQAANQRYLMAALGTVRAALDRYAARTWGDAAQDAATVEQAQPAAAPTMPDPAALETLCATFELSPFERDLLLLCAGAELDVTFAAACAAAHGDPRRAYPTFGLALAALPEAHWSALTPEAPLRRWRLIEAGGGDVLAERR